MHLDLRDRNRGLQDARRNRAGKYFVEEEGKMRRHQDEYQIGDIKKDLVRREEMTRGPAGNGSVSAGVGRGTRTRIEVNSMSMTYSCMWSTASISIQSAPILFAYDARANKRATQRRAISRRYNAVEIGRTVEETLPEKLREIELLIVGDHRCCQHPKA